MRGIDNKRRPPKVSYKKRARFDQALTNRNGRSTYVDEDVAEITSPDNGVTLTMTVKEWFAKIDKDPANYLHWSAAYKQMYRDWNEAHDTEAVDGTHISNWSLLSPGQCETYLHANYRTIESIAEMTDEVATTFDGGLFIRSKARYWINSAEDIGGITSEIASLKAENETLLADVQLKGQKIAEMKSELDRLTAHFTGKEGYDVIAGRVQPVGLQIVRDARSADAQPQVVAPQPVENAPVVQQQPSTLLTLDAVKVLDMAALRSYCYEHNVKPSTAKAETYERLIEAKQLTGI
jgi:hypothetical protein